MKKRPTVEDIEFGKDGIYLLDSNKKTWVADPILIDAFATNNEGYPHEKAFIVVKFLDRRGNWKSEIVPSSLLTGHISNFVDLLSTKGYLWPRHRKIWQRIISALSVVKPSRHVCVVDVPGWHNGAFVLPGEAYTSAGPNHKDFVIARRPTVKLGAFVHSGTLDQWKKIARLCCYSTRARCLMAAAFTAPNLRLFKLGSFGINLSGDTTSGKSFLVKIASSAPGLNVDGGPDTWDGSFPAIEQRVLGYCDSIMALDELGHIVDNPTKVVKLVTFRLASNRSRDKAGEYVRANDLIDSKFHVIFLSTSEDPIWQPLHGGPGQRAQVRGEQVRMVDLPACVSKFKDVFDLPKADVRIGTTTEERAATIDAYAKLAERYQGEAYRTYLAKRAADGAAAVTLRKYMTAFFQAAPLPKEYRWLRRIGQYFAAMYASAALAIDYGVLPWSKKATLADLRTCIRCNETVN
jgi:putative DNA primase/helicase